MFTLKEVGHGSCMSVDYSLKFFGGSQVLNVLPNTPHTFRQACLQEFSWKPPLSTHIHTILVNIIHTCHVENYVHFSSTRKLMVCSRELPSCEAKPGGGWYYRPMIRRSNQLRHIYLKVLCDLIAGTCFQVPTALTTLTVGSILESWFVSSYEQLCTTMTVISSFEIGKLSLKS